MTRTQWWLTGILAIQVLLLVALVLWSGDAGAHTSRPLIEGLDDLQPAKIRIEEPDKTLVLARNGEVWGVEGSGGYPAKPSKIEELLNSVREVKVRRPVVTGSRYHAALKVTEADHERRLQIWDGPSADPKVDLFLGTSPNYRVTHVRVQGQDPVYEARGISAFDVRADPGSWIEKEFVKVDFDRVQSVRLSNAHGEFAVGKDESGAWTLLAPSASAGKTLDESKVDSFVRSVSSLFLRDPVGPVDVASHGFERPSATLEIVYRVQPEAPAQGEPEAAEDDTEEPEPAVPAEPKTEAVKLVLGGEVAEADGERYASRAGFDFAVTLSKFDTGKLIDKKLADLLG